VLTSPSKAEHVCIADDLGLPPRALHPPMLHWQRKHYMIRELGAQAVWVLMCCVDGRAAAADEAVISPGQ